MPAQHEIALRVAPDRPLGSLDALTYALPSDSDVPSLGSTVKIPLGRGNRAALATVIEHVSRTEAEAEIGNTPLKLILGLQPARVPGDLLELARWVSAYYHSPLGPTISSILPAAVRKGSGLKKEAVLAPAEKDVTDEERNGLTPSVRSALDQIRALPAHIWPLSKQALRDVLEIRSVRPLNMLLAHGYLTESNRTVVKVRGAAPTVERSTSASPVLTSDQSSAVDAITRNLGSFEGVLLEGVTGSGKTEVYLHSLDHTLARGESAIVLVPEIALTPQTASRFTSRFPNAGVVVLHSAMTATQRHAAWKALESGEARVALGPRSAVFAPLPHRSSTTQGALGLIVVDEEHDGSYKQDQSPRYHARDVAIKRAQLAQCPVVLGTATPSLESFANAGLVPEVQPSRFTHVHLAKRVAGGQMPPVQVVDLMHERAQARQLARRHGLPDRNSLIGPTLLNALRETLSPSGSSSREDAGQAILLLNRRGYAGYIASAKPETEWVLMCQHCDVNLVAHSLPQGNSSATRYAKCHHCGAMTLIPEVCPEDGSKLMLLNFGTQRLEEELHEQLAGVVTPDEITRVDADTMRSNTDYHETLSRFRSGETKLLLGTQMIAKGLDFPNVRLIGVVNADTALSLPDFRATERTAQLIAQVAGRAGRSAESAGRSRVVVQTTDPTNVAIQAAANHDYRSFAREELRVRAQYKLPPAHRMARIVFRELDHDKATARANTAAATIRAANINHLSLRGPAPAPITRVNDRYRIELVLVSPTTAPVQTALALLRNHNLVTADISCVVDVDPIALV